MPLLALRKNPCTMEPATPPTLAATAALAGVDFSSSPRRSKPIVWAWGRLQAPGVVRLERLELDVSLAAFAESLGRPGPWIAAFDFPFALSRELVQALGWPLAWDACMAHYATLERAQVVAMFAAFCHARPAGSKFAHRGCDVPAGASPSMKWVNPPVALMLHAGVAALRAAGVDVPGLRAGDASRVALEGYPGMVARGLIGRRSYKSDTRAKQTAERFIARKDLVEALEQGRWRGVRLKLTHAQREALVADAQGDVLDAAICLVLAAWAVGQPAFGMPATLDPLEGWIVGADPPVPALATDEGREVRPGRGPSLPGTPDRRTQPGSRKTAGVR